MKTKRFQDYTKTVKIGAPCAKVHSALSTLKGLRGWWTPLVNGKPTPGGKVRFKFEGLDESIDIKVEISSEPFAIHWTCLKHTALPEWDGTEIEFTIARKSATSCILNFRHIGLSPELDCFNDCKLGWDHFLASIVALVENGTGMPFGDNRIKSKDVGFDLGATLAKMLKGSAGLLVNRKMNSTNFTSKGKVFAFTKGKGEVVLKLPPEKVYKLLASKKASSLVMGKRTMKEWVVISCGSQRDCQKLLTHFEEAKTYVSIPKERVSSRK